MATFRIFLGDVNGLNLNWLNVMDATWYYFNKSVTKSSKDHFDKVDVKVVTSAPALMPEDLLIYLVRDQADNVLESQFGIGPTEEDQYGLTAWANNLFGCEVYVRDLTSDPWMLAKFIWHESLHAKTMEEKSMHKRRGLASDPVTQSTEITAKNIESMRKRLTKQRPMWTGGF